jgi:hypothetical protein
VSTFIKSGGVDWNSTTYAELRGAYDAAFRRLASAAQSAYGTSGEGTVDPEEAQHLDETTRAYQESRNRLLYFMLTGGTGRQQAMAMGSRVTDFPENEMVGAAVRRAS